jgi:hypothetical protein
MPVIAINKLGSFVITLKDSPHRKKSKTMHVLYVQHGILIKNMNNTLLNKDIALLH